MRNFWTTLEVKVSDGWRCEITLPIHPRSSRQYGRTATFTGGESFGPGNTRSGLHSPMQEHTVGYMRMLAALPREFVVLTSDHLPTVERVGELLHNCVAVRGADIHLGMAGHTYFFPLHLHAGVNDWRQKDYDKDWNKVPKMGHLAWVEGRKWEQEPVCLNCPHNLDMTVDLCRPMTVTCKGQKELPFTTLSVHTGEGIDEARNWYYAHPLVTENLEIPEIAKNFEHVEAKDVSTHDAFEAVTLQSLTADEEKLREHRENRSARSKDAAVTRRFRNFICDGCMEAGKWCSYRGGRGCHGPWYEVDYMHLAEACEPWMVWGLEISAYSHADMRFRVKEWRGDRIREHHFAGPRGTGDVAVVKHMARDTFVVDVPLKDVCRILSDQTDLDIPHCTTWAAIRRHSTKLLDYYGWPLPDWVKALAKALAERNGLYQYRSGMYGTLQLVLAELHFSHASITLDWEKGNHGGPSHRVKALEDLHYLEPDKKHTERRVEENKLLHELVLDDDVRITGRCFQHIIAQHPRGWVNMTPGQWKRRANKALRAIGGARKIREDKFGWQNAVLRAMEEMKV